jgi:beta-lactamase regulating signal transducer with metallopeptidase domain
VIVDAQWLTVFLLKATAVLLAGALAAAALRSAAAGTRHLVWLATLAGVLMMPALGHGPLRLEVLPSWPFGFAEGSGARVGEGTPPGPVAAPDSTATAPEPMPGIELSRSNPARPARPRLFSSGTAGLALWAGGATLLLGRLLSGSLAARRIVRSARAVENPGWTRLLHELADRLDLAEAPALLVSERTSMPFAYGALSPGIVLPSGAEEWSEDRRRVVLLHELAHVRRRDLAGHQLGRLACAVYWFHPLVWTAARRLRAESERACDDCVLDCGARASDYAGHLLDLLGGARAQAAPAPTLPMARGKEFEGRLLAILDPARRRSPARGEAAVLLAGLGVIYVAVAAAAPSPATPEPPARVLSAAPVSKAAPTPSAPEGKGRPRVASRTRAPEARAPEEVVPATETEPTEASPEAEPEADRDRRGLLIRVLRSDPEASVRRSAAWALAEGGRGDEVGVLVAALRGDDDAGVREMAAWALSDARNEDATAAVALALERDASPDVRATAAWALSHRRATDKALLAAVRDTAAEVREAALWALGNQGLASAPPEVTAALQDGTARVRLVAAWALGQILDPATAPALQAAFTKEEDATARQAMFRALAFLGERSPELLNRALSSKDPEIRSRAARLLAGGGPGIWPWPWPWPQPRPMP